MFKEQLELKLNDAMYKAANLYPVGSKEYDRTLEEALTSIINLVDKELKGLKQLTSVGEVVDPHDLSKGQVGNIPIQNTYNQAIDDMRAIIRGSI